MNHPYFPLVYFEDPVFLSYERNFRMGLRNELETGDFYVCYLLNEQETRQNWSYTHRSHKSTDCDEQDNRPDHNIRAWGLHNYGLESSNQ